LETKLEKGGAVASLVLGTEPLLHVVLDNCHETSTTTFTMRFLVLELLCSVSNTHRRLGYLELDKREWIGGLGVFITETGLTLLSNYAR
jgi:hypothetical protein